MNIKPKDKYNWLDYHIKPCLSSKDKQVLLIWKPVAIYESDYSIVCVFTERSEFAFWATQTLRLFKRGQAVYCCSTHSALYLDAKASYDEYSHEFVLNLCACFIQLPHKKIVHCL